MGRQLGCALQGTGRAAQRPDRTCLCMAAGRHFSAQLARLHAQRPVSPASSFTIQGPDGMELPPICSASLKSITGRITGGPHMCRPRQ